VNVIVVDPENCGECPYFRQEDGQQYFVFCGREEGIEIKNINEIHPKCPFRKGRMDCWVVWVNEDLTEGRGAQKVLAVCEKEATARRLARGADTQGADGRVMELPVVLVYDLVKSKGKGPGELREKRFFSVLVSWVCLTRILVF
jgi:hypothetical protein